MRSQFSGAHRRTTLWMLAGLAAATLGSASGQELAAPPEARVLVRVNGEPLYAEDLESVLGAIHRTPQVEQRSAFEIDQLVFRLVNDTLLAQEARALGMAELPEVRRRLEGRRESLAESRLFREEIFDKLDQSDEAMRRVYEVVYRTASLRLVTLHDRGEAEALRPRALEARDDAGFAALAREVSRDPYAMRGGVLETPFTNLFQSLYEHAESAPAGELSQPLATPWGWTLARVVELRPADPARFEERRGRVLVELRHQQETALRKALVERLQTDLGLEVDAAVFDSIGVQRMHDGRLLPKFDGPERRVASIAGREVTVEELAKRLTSAWSSISNPTLALEWKRSALDNLIFEELLVAEALRRGYGDTPEVRRELHALELSLLATRYLKEVVAEGIDVETDEVRAYYDSHREEFRRPPRVHQLRLTVPTAEDGERLAALARAGADFGWLARQHSTDPLRERGGELGWAPAHQGEPLFAKEVAEAKAGQVYGPRQGTEGWVVLKVDLVEEQGYYEFEAVSGNVVERLRGRRIEERIDSVISRLREDAEVWTDPEAIAALSIEPVAPEDTESMPGHGG